jgi:hypothetical protein
MDILNAVLVTLITLVLVYVVAVFSLWNYSRKHPEALAFEEMRRLPLDLQQLVKSLIGDKTLPRSIRVRLVLLGLYLASPVDLIPDMVPGGRPVR